MVLPILKVVPPSHTRSVPHSHNFTLLTLQAASASPALVLEECSLHECEAEQLDVEMAGGMAASASQSIPIQLMLLRRVLGGDTVGVKRR